MPTATLLLQAARRVQVLHATELPRLLQLRDSLQREAGDWCCAGLAFVLQAHLSAVSGLRFGLLVAPSLRGAPARDDEAAFRADVEAVSTCTGITWIHVRDQLGQAGSRDSMEPAAMDFVMGSRAFQHSLGEITEALQRVQRQVEAQPALMDDGPAAPVLRERLHDARQRLPALQQAGLQAQAVQRAAYGITDRQQELDQAMQDLANVLRGGLLARLGALVALDVLAPAHELQQAEQARAEVQQALSATLAALQALRQARLDLLDRVEAMAPAAPSVPA